MKISLRIIMALLIALALMVAVFTWNQARIEEQRLTDDLLRRSQLLAESLHETLVPALASGNDRTLRRIVDKFGNRERLAGLVVFDAQGRITAATKGLEIPADKLTDVRDSLSTGEERMSLLAHEGQSFHAYLLPLRDSKTTLGLLALIQEASYIDVRVRQIWTESFIRWLTYAIFIAVTTLVVVQWSMVRPIARMAEWMKQLRLGKSPGGSSPWQEPMLGPLASEARQMMTSLTAARAAAEEEARLRQSSESRWTPQRLKEFVRGSLQGRSLFLVSNREPYIHTRKGKTVECIVPASGLVTALDPVMRACEGLWIAHGSGDADPETVDDRDHVRVPPDEPAYTLRRLWLTKEEEEGYYYGFANDGLWPLCHIAHTRPLFRRSDWKAYQAVNAKFAQALLEEISNAIEPLVLIQDYHFALLPRLIKAARPDARIGLFWHIPWPNPEAFAICPWQREILDGMLGADLIGFHIQFQCNNFLETVDRTLECRIDRERFSVARNRRHTLVKPYPISIGPPPAEEEGDEGWLKEFGISGARIGVGVDRLDYTKGILERFRGVERFFEKYPSFRERFVFVELGAPSRTHIPRYHDLVGEIEAEAERINWRFRTKGWSPILLLKKHHSHREIHRWYRIADFCLVTSLHDGMNLVAKEYVAARSDGRGVLILSTFAGASRELADALIVNPYDIEQIADAVRYALDMTAEEQRRRMKTMQDQVRENNVYRWAAALINDLAHVRASAETIRS